LDWASREPDNHLLRGKAVAIMGAAGGMGSSRAQYHLRQVCVYLDLHPLNKPEVFANAFSGAFDHEGNLLDVKIQDNIRQLLQALALWQQRLQR
jgi:chromate reductase